jgi:hypothetical protein
VTVGLKPKEIWELELWEYNVCVTSYSEKQKLEMSNAILTGYYCAYYMNGGKKAKSPNDLIEQLHSDKSANQLFEQGIQDIERIRRLES